MSRLGISGLIKILLGALVLVTANPASVSAAELVMVETRTCIWCIRWHREIGVSYDKTEEGRIAPLQRHWLENGQPQGIELTAPVRMTPTFLVVEEGREVGRIVGYPGEDAFWSLLGQQLEKLQNKPAPAPAPAAPLTRTSW